MGAWDAVLAELSGAPGLELTGTTALLLLLIDAPPGLLLERGGAAEDLVVHGHGFLHIGRP